MRRGRGRATRVIAAALNGLGGALLLLGATLGWLVPRLPASQVTPAISVMSQRLGATHIDASSYLAADITALAVLIAVVIGFNVTILQIAGQTHSLNLVRGILASLTPFLLCWSITSGIALAYFLVPLVYVGQLWQQLAWFGAVVVLMVAYLWNLPWRLSGDYVAHWALGRLRGRPVATWEPIEGYSALQTALAGAEARGDLGTARAIAVKLGWFLVSVRDLEAEAANQYHRGRYRALKNLLSGCAQGLAQAPNGAAYYLGYVQAGVLLQAVADGHPTDDREHDLFTGLVRSVRDTPERLNAVWTGLRHALCRPTDGGEPYLLAYWLEHDAWPVDDLRRVTRIATALARFHAACWEDLQRSATFHEDAAQAAEMVIDLYRDLAEHLGPAVARAQHRTSALRLPDLPLSLVDETHALLLRQWAEGTGDGRARIEVVNAYERYRARLGQSVTLVDA